MPSKELTTSRERAILEECQEVIGYRFQKPELLRAALTHTSGANTRLGSNERLEFLGDSVLGLVTCEQLFHRFPEYQEGDLTKVKSVVVSRNRPDSGKLRNSLSTASRRSFARGTLDDSSLHRLSSASSASSALCAILRHTRAS